MRTLKAFAAIGILAFGGYGGAGATEANAPALDYQLSHSQGRTLLADDPDHGRIVEVIGDLASATDVAVLIPGVGESYSSIDEPAATGTTPTHSVARAKELIAEAHRLNPKRRLAVIAWLGYKPPTTLHWYGARSESAIDAGANLARLADEIPATAHVTWICHSYGTVVCRYGAPSNTAVDIVLVGSPGVDAGSVSAMHTSATVWAGTAADDPIRFVPKVRILGFGHGTDPSSAEFGAEPIPTTGSSSHSGYFTPGSLCLRSMAAISIDQEPHA